MVTAFITSTWHNRIPVVVNTASAFLSSLHYGEYKSHVSQTLTQLLPWVLGLLSQLLEPNEDPELAQSCIEFIQRAMLRNPGIFMSQSSDSLEFIFTLALKLLDENEPLPKAAAVEFWVSFRLLNRLSHLLNRQIYRSQICGWCIHAMSVWWS